MRKRTLFGFFVIGIGVVIFLSRIGIIEQKDLLDTYWPIILIGIGLINIADKHSSKLFGFVTLGAGILFQVKNLDVMIFKDIPIEDFAWPLIIIVIGLWLIVPKRIKCRNINVQSSLDNISVFSGSDIVNEANDFTGGQLSAIFGGCDVNLKNATIVGTTPVVIEAFVAFGGIDILVPEDWKVQVKGIPLFGGWSNKTIREKTKDNKANLIINCFIMFGGLEVRS